ncbi:MAG: aminodeoxychorismate/anthranilate synthase component II [Bacteroidia bacterium]|nr:aminodeoxychorismate/anthranilate synthase component II [Bacteroidia bacterium]
MKLLVLDNYDSFTYNLVHIIRELGYGAELEVHRNDALPLEVISRYDKIVLSPGPGIPAEAGIMPALIRQYAPQIPMLGVCLGHQAIAEALGGELYNLSEVYHGVGTPIRILKPGDPLFQEIPAEVYVGRYHSWAVRRDTLPPDIHVLAEDEAGAVMALRHAVYPVCGVQFHPESVITQHGKTMISNWLQS